MHIYIYIYIFIYIYIYMYICISVCVYVYICINTYVHIYIYIYIHTHVYIHIFLYIIPRVHSDSCTYTSAPSFQSPCGAATLVFHSRARAADTNPQKSAHANMYHVKELYTWLLRNDSSHLCVSYSSTRSWFDFSPISSRLDVLRVKNCAEDF